MAALTTGVRAFARGDKVTSQRMMKLRVAAQGATIFAVIYYVMYKPYRLEIQQQQKQAEMSRIRDLATDLYFKIAESDDNIQHKDK